MNERPDPGDLRSNRRNWFGAARRVGVPLAGGVFLGWMASLGCAAKKGNLETGLINQAWTIVQQRYVDQAAVKPAALTHGAIAGMVDALGDTGHSTFLTAAMVKRLKSIERGELKGIGVEIQMKAGRVVVVAPLDNSPAQRAGLHAGDVILRVALVNIQRESGDGVILDLRDNPGGLLNEAVHVASQFLTNGNVLLIRDAAGHVQPVPVEKGGVAPTIPLVVLVNIGTASAAEIVAGSLRDAGRATIVGETTFGTGTVLEQFPLADGSALLLAIEEWLTPDGHSFWHKGISPSLRISLPDDALPLTPEQERNLTADEIRSSPDRQLVRALELLTASRSAGDAPLPPVGTMR